MLLASASNRIWPPASSRELNQVFDHLLLAIDGDGAPAAQLRQRNAVTLAFEAQLDAVVDQSLAQQAFARASLDQQIDRALLEDTRTHALFDVVASARFEDNGLDASACQQMSQHEASGASADDPDLRAHTRRILPR